METRVSKLEVSFEFVKEGIGEIKTDVKNLRSNMDTKLGVLGDKVEKTNTEIGSAKNWAMGLYAALVVGLLVIIARVFH